jgi:hypothetical protein
LKISVPPSDDAFISLWDALYLLITKLQTVDTTLIVYPWEESDLSDKVLTNANIPKTVVELKQFFFSEPSFAQKVEFCTSRHISATAKR